MVSGVPCSVDRIHHWGLSPAIRAIYSHHHSSKWRNMIPFGVVVVQVFACLGYGAIILHLSGILDSLATSEQFAWALGFGTGAVHSWRNHLAGGGSPLVDVRFGRTPVLGVPMDV